MRRNLSQRTRRTQSYIKTFESWFEPGLFLCELCASTIVVLKEEMTPEIALWSGGHAYSSDVSTLLASVAVFDGRTFRYTDSGELVLPSTISKSRSIEMPKWRSFAWRYG